MFSPEGPSTPSAVISRSPPRVTIGLPVFNGERYLHAAMSSLLGQTFQDFELIISDNASSDRTEAICRGYAASDNRVRYIRQKENGGAAFNFNAVLREAKAEYFMWAAADDTRSPEFLALAVQVLDTDPECGLVFCDYQVRNVASGATTTESVAMFNVGKPWKRYLVRLLSPCPSLIYGLQRVSSARQQPSLGDYDFFDVHFTHWYALNSVIKVLPLRLYVAGVKGRFLASGQRVPEAGSAQPPKHQRTVAESGITSEADSPRQSTAKAKRFDASRFIAAERRMLFDHCTLLQASALYCLMRYFYFKNVRQLNAVIDAADQAVAP